MSLLDDVYDTDKPLKTRAEIEAAHDRAAKAAITKHLRAGNRVEIYPGDGDLPVDVEGKSPGQLFVESPHFEAVLKSIGGASGEFRSPAIGIPGGLRSIPSGPRMRAPITGAAGSAGALVPNQHVGLIEPGLVRPLTVRDLVTVLPMQADAVEYVKEATRASNAATVAEASQIAHTGDEVATKPEGGLTFTSLTTTARWIAEHVAITRSIAQDRPQLRSYIDDYLIYDVNLELEEQMLSGNGTGQNFTGILNTAGIQTVAAFTAPAGPLDNLRKGLTLVRLNGRANPNAVILNPSDAQNIDLLKENNEANNFVASPFTSAGPRSLWGVPVVESDAIAAGTALVGDFKKAILFDRQEAQILLGTVADDFVRNIVRILCELRAAWGVVRPSAFCTVSLVSA